MGFLCEDVGYLVGDVGLTSFIITPLCAFFFHGAWLLFDLLLLPVQSNLSLMLQIFVALLYMVTCNSTADRLDQVANIEQSNKTVVITKLYYYVAAVVVVCIWRGIWGILDLNIETSLVLKPIVGLLSLVVLIVSRNVSNLIFPPGRISQDKQTEPFHVFHSRLQSQACTCRNTFKCFMIYVIDIIVSYGFINTSYAAVWWTAFTCEDELLFPDNIKLSATVCVIYGYVTYLIQLPIRAMIMRVSFDQIDNSFYLKLFLYQFLNISFSFSTMNIWRGILNLSDVYIYPETVWKRAVILHVLGSMGLAFLGVSRSMAVVKFEDDGDVQCLQRNKFLQLQMRRDVVHQEEETFSLLNLEK
ncbi:uncharacterized protein LOC117113486 [Anneissia japonica]|uniref:uncharacterized protein LOC117113486 n=1 Tax=Anneissia japonica TaxID=1529436 RepID=UPI0014259120|nr:uncharacterized protein LOC117113486 [Anneissia japonica]